MGNSNNCCCISRAAAKKQAEVPKKTEKKPKTLKKNKKATKILEKSIQSSYKPEIHDFLETLHTKFSENSTIISSAYSYTEEIRTQKSLLTETSFSDPLPEEKAAQPPSEIIYIDLPEYSLDSIQSLSERQQREISWLLSEYNANDEEIDGFLSVTKKNRYGIKQHRWLLFTNASVYVTMPQSITTCRNRIKLVEIINLYCTSDNKMFCLEVLSSEKLFFSFYSERALDALGAIQNLLFFISEQVKELVRVNNEKDIIKKVEAPVVPLDDDLLFVNIKADYGFPGEKLLFTYEVTAKNEKNAKVTFFVFMTNRTLYLLDAKKKLFNFVEIGEVIGIVLIENTTEGILKTVEGDFWMVSVNSAAVIEDVKRVVLECCKEMIENKTVMASEVEYRGMRKMKSSKKRKVPLEMQVDRSKEKPVYGLNFIDDVIRAI